MSPGRHAAPNGSFGRSAGGAAFRGALLIGAAVLIGVLLLNANDDDPFFAEGNGAAAATTTTSTTEPAPVEPRPAAEVEVLVANGSAIGGAAGGFSEHLAGFGYNVLPATDTTEKPAPAAVYFAAGFDVEARAIAAQVGLSPDVAQPMPDPVPVADLAAAEVLVVLDPALAEQGPPPAA